MLNPLPWTHEQAHAFAKKNPGTALAVIVDVLIETIEAPLPPRDHPDYVEKVKNKHAASAMLDRVNEDMKPLLAICRREMVSALAAEMPLASRGARNEIKQWAAEQVVKEALRIGMNELLAEAAKPTNH
jgi:hypothetical protein